MNFIITIALTASNINENIFKYKYIDAFPLIGKGEQVYIGDSIPNSLQTQDSYLSTLFNVDELSVKTSTYGVFDSNGDLYGKSSADVTGNTKAQTYIEGVDILNFILQDWYINQQLQYIINIYIEFDLDNEDVLLWGYPAGIYNMVLGNSSKTRPWYIKSKEYYQNLKENNSEYLEQAFQIVSYENLLTDNPILTLCKAFNDDDGNFLGVIGFDIDVNKLQSYFSEVRFYETGYLVILSTDGYVINNPFNQSYYFIYDESVTGFGQSLWDQIQEAIETDDQIIEAKNDNGDSYLILAKKIYQFDPEMYQILCIFLEKDQAYKSSDKTNEEIANKFTSIMERATYGLVASIVIALAIFIVITQVLIKPLKTLTNLAQQNKDKQYQEKDWEELKTLVGFGSLNVLVQQFEALIKRIDLDNGANTELKINFSDIKDFPKEKNSGTNLSDWGSKLEKIIEQNKKKLKKKNDSVIKSANIKKLQDNLFIQSNKLNQVQEEDEEEQEEQLNQLKNKNQQIKTQVQNFLQTQQPYKNSYQQSSPSSNFVSDSETEQDEKYNGVYNNYQESENDNDEDFQDDEYDISKSCSYSDEQTSSESENNNQVNQQENQLNNENLINNENQNEDQNEVMQNSNDYSQNQDENKQQIQDFQADNIFKQNSLAAITSRSQQLLLDRNSAQKQQKFE